MALADHLAAPPAPLHGKPCSIGAILNQLEDDELAALVTMLGTPEQRGWPADAIYDVLIKEGHKPGRQSINRHRGGKCRCER